MTVLTTSPILNPCNASRGKRVPSTTPLERASYVSVTGMVTGEAPRFFTISAFSALALILRPFRSATDLAGFFVKMKPGAAPWRNITFTSSNSFGLNFL